jgi:hypothetical protein
VLVDDRTGDLGRASDVLDRRGFVPTLGEELLCDVEQLLLAHEARHPAASVFGDVMNVGAGHRLTAYST